MDEANPTARALACLTFLHDHPGIQAADLAERLGVSDRAARRYIATLREAGIPVESERGPYGGYRIGRGHRTPLLLSPPEALGLVMAVLDGHRVPDDTTDPVGSALGKLLRALPESIAAQAQAMRRTAATTPDGYGVRPAQDVASTLVTAVAERRRVQLGYRSESGSQVDTDVDPWAVVVRHGRWYLLCHAHHVGAVRTYRLDRIVELDLRAATFTPPEDLDPVAVLEANLGVGWEYPTHVIIDAALHEVEWLPRHLGVLRALDDHTSELVGSTGNPWSYAEYLIRLGSPYHIVASDELRACARTLAERMLAACEPVRPS